MRRSCLVSHIRLGRRYTRLALHFYFNGLSVTDTHVLCVDVVRFISAVCVRTEWCVFWMVSTKKCAFNYSTMRADEMRLAIVWVSVFFCAAAAAAISSSSFSCCYFWVFCFEVYTPYGKAKCRGEKHDKDFVGVGIWLWNCWKWSLNMHSPPALMQFEMCSIPLYSHASMLKSRFRHIALQLHNCARCRFGNFGFSVCLHLLNTSGNDAICAENNHPKNRCAF